MPSLEFIPVSDYGLAPTAELLARGFADYFVKLPFTTATLLQAARTDSVDLAASRVALREGVAVGTALIARRGWTCRLAGMSLVPEARRAGVGRSFVEHLLAEARARGDRAMVLEVIEQNQPAVALYERCGFARVRRLVGFVGRGDIESPTAGAIEEVDLRAMGSLLTAQPAANLPWQLSGETIAQLCPPAAAFRLGETYLALANLDAPQIAIRALVTRQGCPMPAEAAAILLAARGKCPGKEWRMSAIWPEEWSDRFTAAGFVRQELTQWQMARAL